MFLCKWNTSVWTTLGLSKNSSFIVKQNMTMMLLPEKKICYLMPLSEEVPTPAKLESDLDQTEVRTRSFFQTNNFNLRWALSTTRNCFWNIIDGKEVKRSQNFPIFQLLVRNTTAVFFCEFKNLIKSLFANYSLQSSFECCHLNVTHLGSL